MILSLLLSVQTVCMTRVNFKGLQKMVDVNYMDSFGVSAIILGIILYIFFYVIICVIDEPIKKFIGKHSVVTHVEDKDRKRILGFWAIIIFITWIPYYLSYYPGGIYADTFGSISFVITDKLSNRHPLLYNTLISFFIHLGDLAGKNLTWSIGLFCAVQMLIIECEFIYFISWMLRYNISRSIRIANAIFLVFFPLIPLYAISIWKDTPFCMAIFFWMMFIVDLYFEIKNENIQYKSVIGYEIGCFLVAFTRNNGIYVIIINTLFLIILLIRKIRTEIKTRYVIGASIISIAVIMFVQGPIYNIVGVEQTNLVENFGIPLQQIGAVVVYEGNITEEQKNQINNFISYESIKEHYTPCLADNLKWNENFNEQYFSEHIDEFLKLWFQLLKQNPTIFIKSYLMATLGFWDIDVATGDAYVQNFIWPSGLDTIDEKDYFNEWFGFSFKHFVNPRHFISNAWFFWIFLVSAWFVAKHYGIKSTFLFTPQLGIWLTLMVATPIAVSLRYIAANMFTLGFTIIVPILLERNY